MKLLPIITAGLALLSQRLFPQSYTFADIKYQDFKIQGNMQTEYLAPQKNGEFYANAIATEMTAPESFLRPHYYKLDDHYNNLINLSNTSEFTSSEYTDKLISFLLSAKESSFALNKLGTQNTELKLDYANYENALSVYNNSTSSTDSLIAEFWGYTQPNELSRQEQIQSIKNFKKTVNISHEQAFQINQALREFLDLFDKFIQDGQETADIEHAHLITLSEKGEQRINDLQALKSHSVATVNIYKECFAMLSENHNSQINPRIFTSFVQDLKNIVFNWEKAINLQDKIAQSNIYDTYTEKFNNVLDRFSRLAQNLSAVDEPTFTENQRTEFKDCTNNLDEQVSLLSNLRHSSSVHESLATTGDEIKNIYEGVEKTVVNFATAAVDTVSETANTVSKTVVNVATAAGDTISEGANTVGKTVVNVATAVGDTISEGANTVGKTVVNVATAVGDTISEGANTLGQKFVKIATAAGDTVSEAANTVGKSVHFLMYALGLYALALVTRHAIKPLAEDVIIPLVKVIREKIQGRNNKVSIEEAAKEASNADMPNEETVEVSDEESFNEEAAAEVAFDEEIPNKTASLTTPFIFFKNQEIINQSRPDEMDLHYTPSSAASGNSP